MSGLKYFICMGCVSLSLFSYQGFAAQLSPSTEVQENIKILKETKSCPKCDLRGANLNRTDLSGANLEGANLSRASFALSDFSGANLQNADLRETIFNGADLANADMRGADLTGASLVGAYLKGALLDGKIIKTQPYSEHDEISTVTEEVYVEDTVNPKTSKEPNDISIGSRRDFEESPPTVPGVSSAPSDSIPQESAAAPEVKMAPSIQEVNIEEQGPTVQGSTITAQSEEKVIPMAQPSSDKVDEGVGDATVSITSHEVEPVVTVNSGQQGVKTAPETTKVYQEKDDVKEETFSETTSQEQKQENASPGMVDSAVEMIENMFSRGGAGNQPQTETMKNVAILLDVNKCYGCNLNGAILSGEDLGDADLEGASLKGAKLSGTDLQNANLKGADLSGADLSGADLSGADLYRANLSDADLSKATLDETKLDDADLSQVKGYQDQGIMLVQ